MEGMSDACLVLGASSLQSGTNTLPTWITSSRLWGLAELLLKTLHKINYKIEKECRKVMKNKLVIHRDYSLMATRFSWLSFGLFQEIICSRGSLGGWT